MCTRAHWMDDQFYLLFMSNQWQYFCIFILDLKIKRKRRKLYLALDGAAQNIASNRKCGNAHIFIFFFFY